MTRGATGLAVIVVNFGSSDLLTRNLTRSTTATDHVVVVDCYSSAGERDRVRSLGDEHGWDVVLLDDNLGFGGGMNAGMTHAAQAGATHYLLLNPDAVIDRASVAILESAIARDPLTLVSPRVVDAQQRVWFAGADVDLQDGVTRGVAARTRHPDAETWEWISGACMMLSESLRALVGGFDEDYFLYWEDVDLSRRVVTAGGRLRVEQSALAQHDEGGTHRDARGERAKSRTYYRYMIRNRMVFAVKHLDRVGVRRWRRSDVRVAWSVLMQGGRRQLLAIPSPIPAALRGLREGRAIAAIALQDDNHPVDPAR